MAIVSLLALAAIAPAQDGIRYPPLAKQARIQGDVVISHGTVVSGHPILVPAALQGLPSLGLAHGDENVVFHFVVRDAGFWLRPQVVRSGSAFERFIWRLLGTKTGYTIEYEVYGCGGPSGPSYVDYSGAQIEVWVYAPTTCVQW